MKMISRLIVGLLLLTSVAEGAEPVAKQFLRYIYGADGIELKEICHPSDDAWMLRGAVNSNALTILNGLKIESKPTGVVSGMVGSEVFFVEIREGKVDPEFNLSLTYHIHKQVIFLFVYMSLHQDKNLLKKYATDPDKVKIVGAGELGKYESTVELIALDSWLPCYSNIGDCGEQLPVIRSSKPADDAKSRTVTYRVPVGDEVISLTLSKEGSDWKVDTSQEVRVPLKIFKR